MMFYSFYEDVKKKNLKTPAPPMSEGHISPEGDAMLNKVLAFFSEIIH